MSQEILTLSIGALFVLGLRHSFDADHVVAITSLISKRRQHVIDAAGIGGAFAFGHFLSAVVFGTIGASLGFRVDILTPALLEVFAGLLAGSMIIVLGVWIVKSCISGRCYEKRATYQIISFNLPSIDTPNITLFSFPIIGQVSTLIYKMVYKVIFACSICLSNWVGFLFSVSPPIPAVAAFLIALSTGNVLNGFASAFAYGVGIFLGMSLIGALEGKFFETIHKRNIIMHNKLIMILGVFIIMFGVWFLLSEMIESIPTLWGHF